MLESTLPAGWLRDEEGTALGYLAEGKRVLEIGSYLGRSTVIMARVAKLVMAVDWHRGDEFTTKATPGLDTLQPYLENLERCGVRDKVISVVGDARMVAPLLAEGAFDFAFVDANHTLDAALHDGELALRCVRSGSIVAFHDCEPGFPEVCEAVVRLGLPVQHVAGSLAYVVKP